MLADSSKGMFSTVIIHKIDRFSRNRYDSAINKKLLQKNRCHLVSVLERLDDSPESIIMEGVLESFSEYYSKNLSRVVKKGQKETALQCKHNGGIPPLGYDVDKDTRKYVINEKEAEIVRLIFSMYANGCGYKEVLRHLNAMGYHSKRGNQFANGSLNNLLKNEKYIGSVRLLDDGKHGAQFLSEDNNPAIISKETYQAVQIEKSHRSNVTQVEDGNQRKSKKYSFKSKL